MKNIYIKETPNGDTRSLKVLDKHLVLQDTLYHIKAVKDVMNEVTEKLKRDVKLHDITKLSNYDEFFEALSTGKVGEEFYKLDWWKLHLTERHHLNHSVPEDVNLLDVLEMLVDCVCAGMARTGTVFPIKLPNGLLQKAVNNTVEMLKESIIVEE